MIAALIERLEQSGAFAAVELAEDQSALMRGTAAKSGTVFVMPHVERAAENSLSTGFRQRVEVQIVTAIVIRRDDDPRGSRRARLLDQYRAAVEAALAGWQAPGPDAVPLELIGGQGSGISANTSLYVQTWATARYIERQR